ncbi:hypothetical protein G5V59_02190 [Nocardioides sp. W3-2-3]|uniref:hypothetical protein n=1 Tax=Nocardioides convexus TaxID=2712224 RepID=UPI0024188594|nr:hypothetical protein [Nocardioides convexus]NGZ99591.1 hypothetical protein [Nocardioides convexus]
MSRRRRAWQAAAAGVVALLLVVLLAWWLGRDEDPPPAAAPDPVPTLTPAPSPTPRADPCAGQARRGFVPTSITLPGVVRRAEVRALPRDAAGVVGVPPVADKQVFAWDLGGVEPGSRQGHVLLNTHTWPDGSAMGNTLLDRLRVGAESAARPAREDRVLPGGQAGGGARRGRVPGLERRGRCAPGRHRGLLRPAARTGAVDAPDAVVRRSGGRRTQPGAGLVTSEGVEGGDDDLRGVRHRPLGGALPDRPPAHR